MIATSGSSINWPMVGRYTILTLALAFFLYLLSLIPKTVEVFLFAVLIAYGLAPVVRRLQRRMPRAVAIVVVYIALVIVAVVFFVLVVPATYNQFQLVFNNAPAYLEAARNFIDAAQAYLKAHLGGLVATNQISQIESANMAKVSNGIETAFGSLSLLVVGIGNAVVVVIFGATLSYFLLTNSDAIRDSYYSLFPDRLQAQARYFSHEVARVVGGFIVGQLTLVAITFVLTYLALLIMHSPFALLLAGIAGICYAIPYIGVVVASVLGFLLGALSGWQVGVIFALIIMLTSKISDFLVPKVMGDSVGVSPIAIIFAVFAGGELFGLWGLLLGIPAAALFKVIWMLWLHPWLTGRSVEIPEVREADAAQPQAQPAPAVHTAVTPTA